MEFRKLGNTDIDVSVICLGTMTWGEQNTEIEAHEQLDYALDQGVNFIDTAEMYPVPPKPDTCHRTEQYIGNWDKLKTDRDKIVLATKAAGPGEFMKHIRGGPRMTKKHIHEAIENSLKRLNTDYIDLYQLHWPDRDTNYFGKRGYTHNPNEQFTQIEETLEALVELKESGKVREFGLSNETPWGTMSYLKLAESKGLPRMMSIQNPYNLLNRTYEIGMAEISMREKIGLLAYSPMAFGALSGKYLNNQWPEGCRLTRWKRFGRYTNEPGIKATEAYCELAKRHGLTPAQMALSFVNSREFVTSNIIGATNMKQLEENISSIDIKLSSEILSEIEIIQNNIPNPCP